MLARANTVAIIGVEALPVTIESQCSNGLPHTELVGLARGAARESLVRAKAALVASGVKLSNQRTIINMLPAELPKEASALDLALAVSLAAITEEALAQSLARRRFYGELSLGGVLEPVRGAVLAADLARRAGEQEIVVPPANAAEAALIPGVRVIAARTLAEVLGHLRGEAPIAPVTPSAPPAGVASAACLSEVHGQARAKRALELAAAGGHNLLMIGPPGSGKTMLARRLPGILPPLDTEESIEVTRVHSAAGLLRSGGMIQARPFRAPHHTASEVALCGGGSVPRPGEVTLAHRGVLFLDELPEFSRRALEALREPLEDGIIHVARASMSLCLPARVLLVAAMNPCPCGYYRGDLGEALSAMAARPCVCAFEQIQRYRSRISGPLLDRIDLHVTADVVPYRDYAAQAPAETSESVRERVTRARAQQTRRLGPGRCNAAMDQAELRAHVRLDARALGLLEAAIDDHGLSTRAVSRILKVARTIADLRDGRDVLAEHVHEAIGLRLLDRDELGSSLAHEGP